MTNTSIIEVKGITCTTDLSIISGNVEKLAGVTSCEVVKEEATSKFAVVYNPELLSEEAIYRAIEDTDSCENPDERPYKVIQYPPGKAVHAPASALL